MSSSGYTVRAWILDHEIIKHTDTKENAIKIAKKIKDAAAVLGLMNDLKIVIADSST